MSLIAKSPRSLCKRVRTLTQSPLWANTAALGSLQVVSLLIPIATMPYLVRMLGTAGYGEYALCLSVVGYCTILADFGSGMRSVRAIAAAREDADATARICTATLIQRLGLGFSAWLAVVACTRLLPVAPDFARLLTLGAPMIPAALANMSWYFQGVQRLRDMVAAQIAVKLSGLALLFSLVHGPADLPRAVLIELYMAALSSVATWLLLSKRLRSLLRRPDFAQLRLGLRESAALFVATLGSTLYANGLILVLGLAANRVEVGYFAIADRIAFAFERILHPLQQAIYPHVNAMRQHARNDALALLRRLLMRTALLGVPATLLIAAVVPTLLSWVGGRDATAAAVPLWIMSPQPVLIMLSNILGVQALLSFGRARSVARVQWTVGVICLALAWPASRWLGAVGASLVSTAAEVGIVALYFRATRVQLQFP